MLYSINRAWSLWTGGHSGPICRQTVRRLALWLSRAHRCGRSSSEFVEKHARNCSLSDAELTLKYMQDLDLSIQANQKFEIWERFGSFVFEGKKEKALLKPCDEPWIASEIWARAEFSLSFRQTISVFSTVYEITYKLYSNMLSRAHDSEPAIAGLVGVRVLSERKKSRVVSRHN